MNGTECRCQRCGAPYWVKATITTIHDQEPGYCDSRGVMVSFADVYSDLLAEVERTVWCRCGPVEEGTVLIVDADDDDEVADLDELDEDDEEVAD